MSDAAKKHRSRVRQSAVVAVSVATTWFSLQLTAPAPLSAVPQDLHIVFVHGFSASSSELGGWSDLILNELGTEYPGRIHVFDHYQDARFFSDEECNPLVYRSLDLPDEPNGGMPVTLAGSDPDDYCDSQGDLALNAVALHDDVIDYFASDGKKVMLIANSMGAAIVRGFLSYSAELGDEVAEDYVDSVIFLQGAHDGSFIAGWGAAGLDFASWATSIDESIRLLEPARPAIHDLTPASDWYEWANAGPDRLPDLSYFNFYSDLETVALSCFFFLGCEEMSRQSWGDGVMYPGTDDPEDLGDVGGARFLPSPSASPSAESIQWDYEDDIPIPYESRFYTPLEGMSMVWGHPGAHTSFGANIGSLEVWDCGTHSEESVRDVILDLVWERNNGDTFHCLEV